MIYPRRIILFIFFSLCISLSAQAKELAADIVTMRNGNIHVGTVKQDLFELETAFGNWAIPYQAIKALTLHRADHKAEFITHAGERISGILTLDSIEVSRLQSPTIPVKLADVASIDFGHNNNSKQNSIQFPSQIKTNSPDHFNIKLHDGQFTLQTDQGNIRVDIDNLRFLDASSRTDEDRLLVQTTLKTGEVMQGTPLIKSIRVSSPYLAEFDFPLEQLSRLKLETTETAENSTFFSHNMRRLGDGPQMLKINGGSFLRGDHQGDGDSDEQPLSIVNIQAFAIGRFEISFDEYDLFCTQTRRDKPDDQEWGRGTRPVINVSWQDALAYVEWLAEKTRQPYRLPSDAEWEFAARATQNSRYWWGDELKTARANCEGCGSLWDGDQTAPVGRFTANKFGLFDTAGNVFEWVADCFHDRFADAPEDGSPIEKPNCGKRVIRGGAWSFPAEEIRSANRWRDFPSRRSDDTGFRVALDLN